MNATLVAFGYDAIAASDVEAIIGPPLQIGFRSILERQRRDPSDAARCVVHYRSLYADAAVTGTVLQAGMLDIIKELHLEATLAVATSKPLIFADPILQALGIREAFEVVAGPTPETDGETKAQTLSRAITLSCEPSEMCVDRSNAVMIGDRNYDIFAAHATGISSVGVTWGYGTYSELVDAGSDAVISRPDELPAIVRALGARG